MLTSTPTVERPRDAGMTIAELVVAIGILMVLSTVVSTIAIITVRTATGLEARLDNTTQGELGIAAASKVLRTAVLPDQLVDQSCPGCEDTAIVTASTTSVTFYANINNTGLGPSKVTLSAIGDPDDNRRGLLVQRTEKPIPLADGSYQFCSEQGGTSCAIGSRVLARGLLWPSPGFMSYLDFNGLPILGPTLAEADLSRISSVDLALTVQMAPGNNRYPPRTALTRVRLPNVEINVPKDQL